MMSVILLSTFAAAVYLMNYNKSITGQIIEGDKGFGVSLELQDFVINATNNTINNQSLIIENRNSYILMEYELNKTLISNDILCDLTGEDMITEFWYNGNLINSGDNLTLNPGFNKFYLLNIADNRSCPLNATLEIQLNELL